MSKHPYLGYMGRNESIEDDFWAAARCSNTTERAACENTADCAWSSCGFMCYDPSVSNSSLCATLTRKGKCQQNSFCAWRDSDATCFSEIADDDGCENTACSSLAERSECESLSKCEWHSSTSACEEASSSGASAKSAGDADVSASRNVSYEGASYCNRTIQKNTQSVSNASGVFEFYTTCADATQTTKTTTTTNTTNNNM